MKMKKSKKDKLKQNLKGAFIGAVGFIFIGEGLPRVYYNTIQADSLYNVTSVELKRDSYTACEHITFDITRNSEFQGEANVYYKLVNKDGYKTELEPREVAIINGKETIYKRELIPCYIEEGTYYLQGAVVFEVNSSEKAYTFETDWFKISRKEETDLFDSYYSLRKPQNEFI